MLHVHGPMISAEFKQQGLEGGEGRVMILLPGSSQIPNFTPIFF